MYFSPPKPVVYVVHRITPRTNEKFHERIYDYRRKVFTPNPVVIDADCERTGYNVNSAKHKGRIPFFFLSLTHVTRSPIPTHSVGQLLSTRRRPRRSRSGRPTITLYIYTFFWYLFYIK